MPNLIHQTFNRPRVLLPVVHCCGFAQAYMQAAVAHANGADGVFLINQGGLDAYEVAKLAADLADTVPSWFVGVNLLGLNGADLSEHATDRRIRGIWDDNADPDFARNYAGLYFGGVAFKYQRPVLGPESWGPAAADAAFAGVGVVTTSGPATGEPAPVSKVQVMRHAIGRDHALALASGITPENVSDFLPYVDAYLVASGIERTFGEFDPDRLRALAELVHGYQPAEA